MSALVEFLSWEVRVPLLVAGAWVVGVIAAGLSFGAWVARGKVDA